MHIADHARQFPEKNAIICAESGLAINYAELEAQSNRSANAIRKLGLARGDVVATLFSNAPEVFVFAWAAQRTGLYSTSISNKLSDKDVSYILDNSGAKLLLVSPAYVDLARRAADENPNVKVYCWGDNPEFPNWQNLVTDLPATPVADESAGTDLLYSSGTTGRPKGVKPPLPTGDIGDDTPLTKMGSTLYGMGKDTIYLSTSPLYHAAPLRWAIAALQMGGCVVIMDKFDAEESLRLIEHHRVTHATFVPTHFVRMLNLPEETRKSFDMSSMKAAIHAAAPCPVPIKRAMIDWLGPILFEYYAGTECCGITALDSQEWAAKPGSVGRAVLGQIHIVGEDGKELPQGEAGQIYFSDGPKFEYLRDPEKTAEAHNELGWATMGDIGRVDEHGYLFLTDRKNFMIISGGVNIYPQEIENALIAHPDVSDAAVIGIPCDQMGEKVVAIVEPLRPGSDPQALSEELGRYIRAELGGVKTPRIFEIVDELPREATGKLLKKKIRDDYIANLQNEALPADNG